MLIELTDDEAGYLYASLFILREEAKTNEKFRMTDEALALNQSIDAKLPNDILKRAGESS